MPTPRITFLRSQPLWTTGQHCTIHETTNMTPIRRLFSYSSVTVCWSRKARRKTPPPLRLHSSRDGTIYQEAISKRADPDEEIQRYGDRLCRDSGAATEVSRTCVRALGFARLLVLTRLVAVACFSSGSCPGHHPSPSPVSYELDSGGCYHSQASLRRWQVPSW